MGIFDFLDRTAGDSRLSKDLSTATKTGYGVFDSGTSTTSEGLTGLRGLNTTYQNQLANPLGAASGIFARARGTLSDNAVQAQRSYAARMSQLSAQSGGNLSPEAQAELNQRNQKDINESKFAQQTGLATKEATMTLNETGKLFDRMESIQKTILGVGQDEQSRGVQMIIESLAGRTDRMKAIWGDVTGTYAKVASGGK